MTDNVSRKILTHDFNKNNVFFLTIVAKHKCKLFSRLSGFGILDIPRNRLTECGKRLNSSVHELKNNGGDVKIENYVIMPNHIHFLISVNENLKDENEIYGVIPKFVNELKNKTNEKCDLDLWQKSYYDHCVKDEFDYEAIWNYIKTNPSNWNIDRLFVK